MKKHYESLCEPMKGILPIADVYFAGSFKFYCAVEQEPVGGMRFYNGCANLFYHFHHHGIEIANPVHL